MRKNIEATDVNIRYFRNQILPDVNLQAGYGAHRPGGHAVRLQRRVPAGPPGGHHHRLRIGALADVHQRLPQLVAGGDGRLPDRPERGRGGPGEGEGVSTASRSCSFAAWSCGGDPGARAWRVSSTPTRSEWTRRAPPAQLAERRLEAEQKKFAAGMSTNFQVIQAQRDLARRATPNCRRSWTTTDRWSTSRPCSRRRVNGGTVGLASASTTPQVSSGNLPTGSNSNSSRQ